MLIPCRCCHRHVRHEDSLCPFCGTNVSDANASQSGRTGKRRIGLGLAVALSVTSGLGCNGETEPSQPGLAGGNTGLPGVGGSSNIQYPTGGRGVNVYGAPPLGGMSSTVTSSSSTTASGGNSSDRGGASNTATGGNGAATTATGGSVSSGGVGTGGTSIARGGSAMVAYGLPPWGGNNAVTGGTGAVTGGTSSVATGGASSTRTGYGGMMVAYGLPPTGGATSSTAKGGSAGQSGVPTAGHAGTAGASAAHYECRQTGTGYGWYRDSALLCTASCTGCDVVCGHVGTKSEGWYTMCAAATAGCSAAGLIEYATCSP